MFSSVDLPLPEGPSRTTNSPLVQVDVDAAQRVHLDLAHSIHLGQAASAITWVGAVVIRRVDQQGARQAPCGSATAPAACQAQAVRKRTPRCKACGSAPPGSRKSVGMRNAVDGRRGAA